MADPKKLDQGTGAGKKADQGLGGGGDQPTTPANTTGSPSYGSYSKRGGGGGGGASAKNAQKEKQQQIKNQGDIFAKRKDDIDSGTKGYLKDLGDTAKTRMGEMDDIAKKQLGNIQQQREANTALRKTNSANIMKQVQWQPNQQKEQSMLMSLRNRMGNAAYGSGIQDLAEGMQRIDDMNDTELINAWKQNEDSNYSNWFQAEQSLISDYNDQAASIQDEYSQFKADYSDQFNKLKRDYKDEISQLGTQYWTALSNMNPELATKENMQKASKLAKNSNANKEALQLAKGTQRAVNAIFKEKGKGVENTFRKSKVKNPAEARAIKILDEARADKTNKGKAKLVEKAAKKAAEKQVQKLSKNQAVSVGKGDEKYTLPNVNLSPVKLKNNLNIAPSEALSKLLVNQANADSQNPLTAVYIRPDRGYAQGGMVDTSRAANSGFSDNLAAFRRV